MAFLLPTLSGARTSIGKHFFLEATLARGLMIFCRDREREIQEIHRVLSGARTSIGKHFFLEATLARGLMIFCRDREREIQEIHRVWIQAPR